MEVARVTDDVKPLTAAELDVYEGEVGHLETVWTSSIGFRRLLATARAGLEDRERLELLQECSHVQRHVVTGAQRIRGSAEDVEVESWHITHDGRAYWGETLIEATDAARVTARSGRDASPEGKA
jgi:hypothetical protein